MAETPITPLTLPDAYTVNRETCRSAVTFVVTDTERVFPPT